MKEEIKSNRPFYDFAFTYNLYEKLKELADLAEEEDWSYKNSPFDHENPVLFYYFHNTFERIFEQNKIVYSKDNEFCCFNTGLVTDNQEPIFALFKKNQPDRKEHWFLLQFCREGQWDMAKFAKLPDIATYFDDPSCLVYDSNLDLRVNYEHIIEDNKERFPSPYNTYDDHHLNLVLDGAIRKAKERVRRNYKVAVPQFYKGKIQLLLPLCLSNPKIADMALLVQHHGDFYLASTCLTLDMAYNNARQLAKPDKDWLQP